MTKKYYVYRFLDKDFTVIYIGKTTNLHTRMKQHFGTKGHLPKDCYDNVYRVDYIEVHTKLDMDIKELYYIGKLQPTYNKVNADYETTLTLNELTDTWVTYSSTGKLKTFDELALKNTIDQKDQTLTELNAELQDVKAKCAELKQTLHDTEQEVIRLKANEKIIELMVPLQASGVDLDVFTSDEAKELLLSGYTNRLYNVFRGEVRAMLYVKGEYIMARHYQTKTNDKNLDYIDLIYHRLDGKNHNHEILDYSFNYWSKVIEIEYLNQWQQLPEDSPLAIPLNDLHDVNE